MCLLFDCKDGVIRIFLSGHRDGIFQHSRFIRHGVFHNALESLEDLPINLSSECRFVGKMGGSLVVMSYLLSSIFTNCLDMPDHNDRFRGHSEATLLLIE